MKLYLASFNEKENFGPGRLISIADGPKPDHVKCDLRFEPFIPPQELVDRYNRMAIEDRVHAGNMFVTEYTKQLDKFSAELTKAAKEEDTLVSMLLPFKDGDTLASWERAEFTNFRRLVAPYLKQCGYEVVVN